LTNKLASTKYEMEQSWNAGFNYQAKLFEIYFEKNNFFVFVIFVVFTLGGFICQQHDLTRKHQV